MAGTKIPQTVCEDTLCPRKFPLLNVPGPTGNRIRHPQHSLPYLSDYKARMSSAVSRDRLQSRTGVIRVGHLKAILGGIPG